MFYDSVAKPLRKHYEYSWDLAGFSLNRQDIVTNEKIYLEIYLYKKYLEIQLLSNARTIYSFMYKIAFKDYTI